MEWDGKFIFGDTCAAYTGNASENTLHQHAAAQLVISQKNITHVSSSCTNTVSGNILLIRPLVPHQTHSVDTLTLVYLEAQSQLARELENSTAEGDIIELDINNLPFDLLDNTKNIIEKIDAYETLHYNTIDKRLTQALQLLSESPGERSISNVAKLCNLSNSRLRALAKEQINLPLSTWLLWRKLEKSAVAISTGANFADAAIIGGFSDQAHFSRTMRRMFGIAPKAAANILT